MIPSWSSPSTASGVHGIPLFSIEAWKGSRPFPIGCSLIISDQGRFAMADRTFLRCEEAKRNRMRVVACGLSGNCRRHQPTGLSVRNRCVRVPTHYGLYYCMRRGRYPGLMSVTHASSVRRFAPWTHQPHARWKGQR